MWLMSIVADVEEQDGSHAVDERDVEGEPDDRLEHADVDQVGDLAHAEDYVAVHQMEQHEIAEQIEE